MLPGDTAAVHTTMRRQLWMGSTGEACRFVVSATKLRVAPTANNNHGIGGTVRGTGPLSVCGRRG